MQGSDKSVTSSLHQEQCWHDRRDWRMLGSRHYEYQYACCHSATQRPPRLATTRETTSTNRARCAGKEGGGEPIVRSVATPTEKKKKSSVSASSATKEDHSAAKPESKAGKSSTGKTLGIAVVVLACVGGALAFLCGPAPQRKAATAPGEEPDKDGAGVADGAADADAPPADWDIGDISGDVAAAAEETQRAQGSYFDRLNKTDDSADT